MKPHCHYRFKLIPVSICYFCFLCSTSPFALAQTSEDTQQTTPSPRAITLCPEISKLAEAVTLARDIGHERSQVFDVINQTVELNPEETQIIHTLIEYAYMHTELTPYEYSRLAIAECYKQIR